jgi:cellulose synthase/poly-beta-1,6-N-acetylglucosamine synthase-like glycosyltransferase
MSVRSPRATTAVGEPEGGPGAPPLEGRPTVDRLQDRGVADAPFVTVAVPCLDEAGYIEACIEALLAQDYPGDRFEILVADGGSRDGTRAILDALAAREPRVRVIDNPARIQSAGLNAMLAVARGEIFVRADVHSDYERDYLRACVEVLEETGADNVGGAARARAKGDFQRAVVAALHSPLGFGGSKYRDESNEGWAESVFPGAFRRSTLERIGGFDGHAITAEDADVNQRIWEAGGRVWLSRRVVVHYYPRDRLTALARQYFQYGQGRARGLLKNGKFLSIRPAVPFLALASESLLALVAPPVAALGLGAYLLLTGAEAVRVGRSAGARAIPRVWAIFPVIHASHGAGFAYGLLRYARSPDWPRAPSPRASPAGG